MKDDFAKLTRGVILQYSTNFTELSDVVQHFNWLIPARIDFRFRFWLHTSFLFAVAIFREQDEQSQIVIARQIVCN